MHGLRYTKMIKRFLVNILTKVILMHQVIMVAYMFPNHKLNNRGLLLLNLVVMTGNYI